LIDCISENFPVGKLVFGLVDGTGTGQTSDI
jgi:hypothetical protein